jgi:hypothetical protein
VLIVNRTINLYLTVSVMRMRERFGVDQHRSCVAGSPTSRHKDPTSSARILRLFDIRMRLGGDRVMRSSIELKID